MGQSMSQIQTVNFENMKDIIHSNQSHIIINTLPHTEQHCLIKGTLPVDEEEGAINAILEKKKNTTIIIYGKNSSDETIYKKYHQLQKLGIKNTHVYLGGMFEWLLLQDFYDFDTFPTTAKKNMDCSLLTFKPQKTIM